MVALDISGDMKWWQSRSQETCSGGTRDLRRHSGGTRGLRRHAVVVLEISGDMKWWK